MKDLKLNTKEPTEQLKQEVKETKRKLVQQIYPHKGHILYSFNKKTKEIKEAVFDVTPSINWYDAVNGLYSKYKKLTKEVDCIYISCLNKDNAIKLLRREYNIAILK